MKELEVAPVDHALVAQRVSDDLRHRHTGDLALVVATQLQCHVVVRVAADFTRLQRCISVAAEGVTLVDDVLT